MSEVGEIEISIGPDGRVYFAALTEELLEVAAALRSEVTIVGLAARREWRRLAEQATRFQATTVAIADEAHYDDLRRNCPAGTRVLAGAAAVRTPPARFVDRVARPAVAPVRNDRPPAASPVARPTEQPKPAAKKPAKKTEKKEEPKDIR